MFVCSTSLWLWSTLKRLLETSWSCVLEYILIDHSRLFMNRELYLGGFSIDHEFEDISFGLDFIMALMPYGDR
jgi:hypothetical protein